MRQRYITSITMVSDARMSCIHTTKVAVPFLQYQTRQKYTWTWCLRSKSEHSRM